MLNIQEHIDLTHLNSLRLQSNAALYLVLDDMEQLEGVRQAIAGAAQFFVLGGGSNLIIPRHYEGLVVHNRLRGIRVVELGSERLVTAMAGENWDDFVAFCTAHQAYGLENLSLIPGTVGASPIQNIGAYGVEVKEFIKDVLVYDLQLGRVLSLTNRECEFSYRNSLLKNNSRYIVLSVSFLLSAKPKLNTSYGDVAKHLAAIESPTPLDLRHTIISIRQSKLPNPQQLGNAGSFFHNPILPLEQVQQLLLKHPNLPQFPTTTSAHIKVSAGWLIDNLGLKGLRRGNVGIYPKQALVLVNYGDACKAELLDFAQWIQGQVKQHYDVALHIEPIILN